MNTQDAFPETFPHLERRDLIRFERHLRETIALFLPHTGCTLHFPSDAQDLLPEYLAPEERLLLPLYAPHPADAETSPLLGVYVARGVSQKDYKALSGHLPKIAVAAMENLVLYKAALSDAATGLFTRQYFLSRASERIRNASTSLRAEPTAPSRKVLDPDTMDGCMDPHPCLAILVIRLHGLRQVVRKHGYTAADDILALLGKVLRTICPEQGTTARAGDYELAVLVPAATAGVCRHLAETVLAELGKVSLPHELTRTRISVTPSIGYAMYPQDITGNVLLKSAREQARILLRKARLAAALAAERLLPGEEAPVLAFGRVLAEGGRIADTLPLSRVMVSLGSSVNAREGQRFSVWSPVGSKSGVDGKRYTGEIVLVEVQENASIAEVLHQADPAAPISQGDSLTLLPREVWGASRTSIVSGKEQPGLPDPATGLLRHGDFLASWSGGRERCETFTLAIVRLLPLPPDAAREDTAPLPDQLMGDAATMFRELFGRIPHAGRYGLTSFMAFHPDTAPEAVRTLYEEFCARLTERFFPGRDDACIAVGLAGYPYLDFRKADVLENCTKALEYGILLPLPHVGVFDTLAMTISADKRFSSGDTLGAMTEYKQALLADNDNALAWNSLGVALARLGRHAEARNHFDRAIALEPGANVLYNMGYTCQCLGDNDDARGYYTRCLERTPDHLYALIRLGQLAEAAEQYSAARSSYVKAGEVPGGAAVSRRYLAGLSLREGDIDKAHEYLYEALAHDPHNAAAMQMLAELYLDRGEDVNVAESLARQSVAIQPERKAGWLALARALERAGRPRDAREALIRAGEL